MKTKTPTFKKTPIADVVADAATTVTEFGWHDVFYAGTHTDNKGKARTYSRADLQEVVDNFAAEKAPLVIGHPKTNAPAHGWVSGLRLTGDDRLEMKADHVNVDFAKAVAAKAYPNRSISLVRTDKGLTLNHVGYLGAVPPALEGLGWQFSVDDSLTPETIEFSLETQTNRSFIDMFGAMRDFIIDKFSLEDANRVIPERELNYQREQLAKEQAEENKQLEDDPLFNKPDSKENDVSEITQEQLDAAIKKAVDATKAEFSAKLDDANNRAANAEEKLESQAFNQRVADCQAIVDAKVQTGALTPAQATGLAEFMASLPQGDNAQTFSFSKADKTEEQSQFDFAKAFVDGLGTKSPLGDDDNELLDHSSNDLDAKAEEYMKEHNCSYADAAVAVSGGA
ncbi:hypothetical protein [Alteromonas sp. KUL49]|uniref:hypothetical protein n=1 Tax=Alteromonas sp. KUL49 TaxID=2480798 RepID=UPI00102EDA90|nr:hypothetical protein [Alteromonas sp. KUL49]TAP38734.1 hypothetical protein EYS00_15135 [Alteromonas sp. KUL49]GEA12689.1 hypothetical protein KUL49_30640 [Alteromonas sp. KUL49]